MHFQNNHKEVGDISSSVSLIQHGKTKKSYLHFQNNDKEFGLYLFLEPLTFQLNKYRKILIKEFVSILSIAIYLNYLKPGKQIGLKLEGRLKNFHQSAVMRHQFYK